MNNGTFQTALKEALQIGSSLSFTTTDLTPGQAEKALVQQGFKRRKSFACRSRYQAVNVAGAVLRGEMKYFVPLYNKHLKLWAFVGCSLSDLRVIVFGKNELEFEKFLGNYRKG